MTAKDLYFGLKSTNVFYKSLDMSDVLQNVSNFAVYDPYLQNYFSGILNKNIFVRYVKNKQNCNMIYCCLFVKKETYFNLIIINQRSYVMSC